MQHIPKTLQNVRSMLSTFLFSKRLKIRNRTGYYSLSNVLRTKSLSRLKSRIFKCLGYESFINAALLSLVSSCTFADGLFDDITYPVVWGKVITVGGGPAWARGGETQSFFANPVHYNTYVPLKETSTMGGGEIVFSLQHTINPYLFGQIGIGLAGAGNADLQGVIWIDSNPGFAYYTYSYRLNHARVTLKGKLLGGDAQSLVNPFISGSFGAAYNHSYHFNAIPVSPLLPPMRGFESNTQLGFAYTLGAGISKAFLPNWRAEVGYEFADWGKSNLGGVPLQPFDKGIYLSNLYSHQLLITLSYLC